MADEFAQVIKGINASGDTALSTDGILPVAVIQDGNWVPLTLDTTTGELGVKIIRLDYSRDNVMISGSTGNDLVINADGSINASLSGAADSVYIPGAGVNLVKGTPATVVTHTPTSATEFIKAFQVSGAGLCKWTVKFGTTSSEATIMTFITTPSNPTYYFDVPDSLKVTTAQTVLIVGENIEKAASPGSDFTGYATLIRQA